MKRISSLSFFFVLASSLFWALGSHATVTVINSTNITLAASQVEAGSNQSENPDVTGGGAGSLVPYQESGSFACCGANYLGDNLDDGDVGAGNPSDGFYAIPDAGELVLDFGSPVVLTSIAVYNGYANRDSGVYELLDDALNTLGAWTISTPQTTGANASADSFWITFDTPVTTSSLRFNTTSVEGNGTNSYREIQVFGPAGPTHGKLLIGDLPSSAILAFDAETGGPLGDFVPSGSGGLCCQVYFSFGPDGNLYVPSRGTTSPNPSVLRYDGVTGAFIDVFATGGGLFRPEMTGFGPDGNLYVSDGSTATESKVLRFDGVTGAFIDVFTDPSDTPSSPESFVFAPNGDLYVSGSEGVLARFDGTSGALISSVQACVSPGSGGCLRQVVVGPDGALYVAFIRENQVFRYDLDLTLLGAFLTGALPSWPNGLAFGPDGNLYLTAEQTDDVRRYDGTTGAFIDVFVPKPLAGTSPIGIAFTPTETDSDGDGVPDDQDICPGGDDNVDFDTDGIPDFCDVCPLDVNNDSDGDNVCDSDDLCLGDDSFGDSDADGLCEDTDPCIGISNSDADGDGICDEGDLCYGDDATGNTDGDGVCDDLDACDGDDATGDTDGDLTCNDLDICPLDAENDADADGICESDDNCPVNANDNQADLDMDNVGDVCDDDLDGDGDLNDADNCPFDANADQADADGDGAGDVCDADLDGDGVIDAADACVPTPIGEVVNTDGCAVSELCPCAHPDGMDRWKNHGAYVKCVAHSTNDFVDAGLMTSEEKGVIQSTAGASSCGHK